MQECSEKKQGKRFEKLTMREYPLSERPYELLETKGALCLSDAQLLAVILQSGTREETALELATRLLSGYGNQAKGLKDFFCQSYAGLTSFKGIGRVKALQILAIAEVAKRIKPDNPNAGLLFNNPAAVFSYCMTFMSDLQQEIVYVLYLNTKNRLVYEKEVSKGIINKSILSPREVFNPALQRGAVSVILVHNHPSGDSNPSENDLLLTQKIKACGELMDILVVDHVIIAGNSFYSFKENGLM